MTGPVRLSDRSTLLIPVAPERLGFPPTITVKGVTLVRKAEHHITVFGFDIGKVLGAAIGKAPALRDAVEALIAEANLAWTVPMPPTMWCLHRDKPRDLQTVIVLVDAPGIADFFAACADRLPAIAPDVVLPAWDPPPPHVTLYTSDAAGKDGIGVRRFADLEQAQRRAEAGETTGLRAFELVGAATP